ncbi:MAG: tetratricopeptide repeat protein [Bacteroidota bacterium]
MKQIHNTNLSFMLLVAFFIQSCGAEVTATAAQQAQTVQPTMQQSPTVGLSVVLPCSTEQASLQRLVETALPRSPDGLATELPSSSTPDRPSSAVSDDKSQPKLSTPVHSPGHTSRGKRSDSVANLFQMASLHREQGRVTGNPRHYTDAATCYQHVLSVYGAEEESATHCDRIQLAYEGLLRIRQALTSDAVNYVQLKAEMAKDKRETQALTRSVCRGVSVVEMPMYQHGSQEATRAYEAICIQSIKCLYHDTTTRLVNLLARFYRESEQELGLAPCKYAVMGLQPVLLELLTPRADAGPAILIEEDMDEATAQRYFRNLIHLVNLRVINLQATGTSNSKYQANLARVLNRGPHAHLSDQDNPYTLIQPVHRMLHYVKNANSPVTHIEAYWAYMLEHTQYVHGDASLYRAYTSQRTVFLEQTAVHKQRASQRMLEGLVACGYHDPAVVDPRSDLLSGLEGSQVPSSCGEESQVSQLEKEIYSLSDTLLPGLALYYGRATSGWDAIVALQSQGVVNTEAAHNLAYAVSFAKLLQLKTYFGTEYQQAPTPRTDALTPESAQAAPQPSPASQPMAYPLHSHRVAYYYTSIPFCHKIGSFLSKQQTLSPDEEISFFLQDRFYDNCDQVNGDIYQRFAQWESAKRCYEAVLCAQTVSNLDMARIFANLGLTCFHLGQLSEAYDYYVCALSILQYIYVGSHIEVARMFTNVGAMCMYLQRPADARQCYERSLSMSQDIYGGNHLDIVDILMKLGMACFHSHQLSEAYRYYERALAMCIVIYQSNHPSLVPILNNLSAVYAAMNQPDAAHQHPAHALSST